MCSSAPRRTSEDKAGFTKENVLAGLNNSLKARPAEPVDREGRDGDGNTRTKGDVAGKVAGISRCLLDLQAKGAKNTKQERGGYSNMKGE